MADYAPSWGTCADAGGYQFSDVVYESKFILELVYIVSVSREIFKMICSQRWFLPTVTTFVMWLFSDYIHIDPYYFFC